MNDQHGAIRKAEGNNSQEPNGDVGLLRLADNNLAVTLAGLEYMEKELGDEYRPCPLIRTIFRAGFLGHKSRSGFYMYDDDQPP